MKRHALMLAAVCWAAAMLGGCASLDVVSYYEPQSDTGTVARGWYRPIRIDWNPRIPNCVSFQDRGVTIACPNTRYDVIAWGPVLPPFVPVTVFPVLIGFITSPFRYVSEEITLQVCFDRPTVRAEVDPAAVSLSVGESVLRPVRVTLGWWTAERDLPVDRVAVVEGAAGLTFHFTVRVRDTKSFVFDLGQLRLNGEEARVPSVEFRKKRGLHYFVMFD